MNREEIAKKIRNIQYLTVAESLKITDILISEIAAAEKRGYENGYNSGYTFWKSEIKEAEKLARVEVAGKAVDILREKHILNAHNCVVFLDKIIAANSEPTHLCERCGNQVVGPHTCKPLPIGICQDCGNKMAVVGNTTMHYECLKCNDISLCKSCNCMTHTVNGKCGKCNSEKTREG